MVLLGLSVFFWPSTRVDAPSYHQITLCSALDAEYLTAPNGGGGAVVARPKAKNGQNVVTANDIFVLRDENGGELEDQDVVQLTSWNGRYLSAENGGSLTQDATVNANRYIAGGWEAFVVERRSGRGRVMDRYEPIVLRSLNGQYLGVDPSSRKLKANRKVREECVFDLTLCSAVIPHNLGWPLSTKTRLGYRFGVDWDVTDKNGNIVKGDDGAVKLHNGYDILGVTANKTEVLAAERGDVACVGTDKSGWGSWITIQHLDKYGSPYTTLYFHVNPKVKKGDKVRKGDSIGTIYPLTIATPHLHFSIRNSAFESGWRNCPEGDTHSAANRGALNRLRDSKGENPNYTPKWPEFFFDPGIFAAAPNK